MHQHHSHADEHEQGRARTTSATFRRVVLGVVLLLVAGFAGYVVWLNRLVRDGDVAWRYEGEGAVRVLGVGERFLVVDNGSVVVVLDRADGTQAMELELREAGFAVGDAVLATSEDSYRLLSATGEELWSRPTPDGAVVAPVAADVDTGRMVLLEEHDEGDDVLRGVDLDSGTESWRRVIDAYGDDPLALEDLQQPERVRLLPVRLRGPESTRQRLTVLSLDGDSVTSVEVDSSPFAENNGRAFVVDDQGCEVTVVTASGQRQVDWGARAPEECHVVSVGEKYALVLTGPWQSEGQARVLAVDLETGKPTGLDVSGRWPVLYEAANPDGDISRGPGDAVVVRDGDEYALYDVRTGDKTWSDTRSGRWSYDAGPAGAVLVTPPSGWVRALTGTDDDSVRHELMDATGAVSGVVYEIDTDILTGRSLVLDDGQAAITFGRDLVMLERD